MLTKAEVVGTWCRSQLPALKGVRGASWKLWDQTRKRDKLLSYSVLHPKPTNKLVRTHSAPFWFGTSHGRPWTHLTHHGPDSGEATTFPHKYSLRYSAAPASKWLLFSGLLRRSPETVPIWTPGTLGTHNSQLRPQVVMRSKVNL